jgi:transcriptional regulator with XRE-family HTH domain
MIRMYREARKKCSLSLEEAAFKLNISARTLSNYESGDTVPSADVVLAMSKLYRQPFLTQVYCRECCGIGRAYSYLVLDNVNSSIESVLLSLQGEAGEAMEMLPDMLKIIRNKYKRADFTEGDWLWFLKGIQEWLDLEHNIECLKIAFNRFTDVEYLIREHNEKCIERHYCISK